MRQALLALTLFCTTLTLGAQSNRTFTESVQTLRCYVAERPDAPPILELPAGEHIAVEFDYLSHNYHRFLYRLEHCDANWEPTEALFETDYLTGNNGEEPIEDYAQSLNTTLLYTHYSLRLPNERIGFRLAGNYRLTLLDDTEGEPTKVAEVCFVAVNPRVALSATASTDTEIDRNDSHQQLTVRLNYSDLPVRDARRELSLVVLQNRRYDNAVRRPAPTSVTGQSPNFWGRSIGWWFMALVDVLDFVPADHEGRADLIAYVQGLAASLPYYQDKDGLWYQVIDQPEREGNFPEASVTTQCMYAIAKAVNKGYIDPKYRAVAEKAFNGLKEKLLRENPDGTLTLTRCCQVGGLGGRPYRDGSYGYYIGEKIRDNDAKATGPYIMGCLELGQTD